MFVSMRLRPIEPLLPAVSSAKAAKELGACTFERFRQQKSWSQSLGSSPEALGRAPPAPPAFRVTGVPACWAVAAIEEREVFWMPEPEDGGVELPETEQITRAEADENPQLRADPSKATEDVQDETDPAKFRRLNWRLRRTSSRTTRETKKPEVQRP